MLLDTASSSKYIFKREHIIGGKINIIAPNFALAVVLQELK